MGNDIADACGVQNNLKFWKKDEKISDSIDCAVLEISGMINDRVMQIHMFCIYNNCFVL